jgi:hypothetical protein
MTGFEKRVSLTGDRGFESISLRRRVRCELASSIMVGADARSPLDEADRLGLKTKRSTTAKGAERGGRPFSRGHIYRLSTEHSVT